MRKWLPQWASLFIFLGVFGATLHYLFLLHTQFVLIFMGDFGVLLLLVFGLCISRKEEVGKGLIFTCLGGQKCTHSQCFGGFL
jgi:hypothetical protein